MRDVDDIVATTCSEGFGLMEPSRPRILYIEDQPDMIDLVRLALRRLNCDIVGATDGNEGLALMRQMRPDLILLDLMLPGSDGWQIRSAMIEDPELCDIPVILVTARLAGTGAVTSKPLPQADAYITKPFSVADIRAAVETILHRRASESAQQ